MVKYNSQQAVEEGNVTVGSSGVATSFTNEPINVTADLSPVIAGVAASTLSGNNWNFTIQGSSFGTMTGFSNGITPDFALVDTTAGFTAGSTNDNDSINLTSWTNGTIQIAGLAGALWAPPANVITTGDHLSLTLINPQTGLMSAPFQFIAATSAPVTSVSDGQIIVNGANTPNVANGTDFGSALQNGSLVTKTYTITNDGTVTLTIAGNITVPSGFSVTQPLSTGLAPNATTTFTVSMTTGNTGTFTGLVNIPTNDPANNPYTFDVTGIVTGVLPTTAVSGEGQPIANGATTTSAVNGTNFGSVVQNGQALTRSFTIVNNSGTALTVGAITPPSGYTVISQPATSVAAGSFTTFSLALSMATLGTYPGQVSFHQRYQQYPFKFNITGTVTFGAASQLVFTQQPIGTTVGTALSSPPIYVSVEDSNGNVVTNNTSNVTIAINSGPAGATLLGTTTVAAVNGVATFTPHSGSNRHLHA